MPSFSDLSPSIIHHIRRYIRLNDLLTHVAFQATSKSVRAVYLEDEKFWKAACMRAGISKPIPELDFPFMGAEWRDLAIICANHLYMCELPMCDLYDCTAEIWDDHGNEPMGIDSGQAMHKFEGFETRLNVITGLRKGPSETHHQDDLGDRRIVHAAGLCKFATAPPVRGLWLNIFTEKRWVYNINGVTQWDVVQAVRNTLVEDAGSVHIGDVFWLCDLAHHYPVVFDKAARNLRWLHDATVSDILDKLKRLATCRQSNKTEIRPEARQAVKDLYSIANTLDPDTRLLDLSFDNERVEKALRYITVTDFRNVIKWWLPSYSTAPWALGIINYESPIDFVNNHFMFTGIEWVEERGSIARPCFEINWEGMNEDEPMEIVKVHRIQTRA